MESEKLKTGAAMGDQRLCSETLTERVNRLESIILNRFDDVIGSGCDRAIMPELRDRDNGDFDVERSPGWRSPEREKEQTWRNERASAAMNQAGEASPELEMILTRIHDLGRHAELNGDRLQIIADRAFGSRPEEMCGSSAECAPEAVIDRINMALSYVASRLHRIEDESSRLSRL